ncbi:MAG: symmetrical bis(5'-nucleosyl)-tetraphosphatase [Betaproteobacteria bacterium]|nr:symmetrical bis(5'-nucleosyl)-tetraphosphatase [Betaproteobacteria bacterium]
MAVYLIGDVQGCDPALGRLLQHIGFSASRDTVYLLGDLVNRGPDSTGVLRRLMALEGSAHCLLGNHDLHALAVAAGLRKSSRMDTLHGLLQAPDRDTLLTWLRQQDLALHAHGVLMVHAGVLPQWGVADTLARAAELQAVLRGPHWADFLAQMYGNEPARWDEGLQGLDRLRMVVNALTRLRFCTADGSMEFDTKEGAEGAPAGFMPWFDVPGRRTAGHVVAFGHWSTLTWLDRPDVLALDSGCVWGGCLTALRLSADGRHERLQVHCPQTQVPG